MANILDLINNNKWSNAIKLLNNDIFKSINNNYNIFHYACMRGNQKIINKLLKLKSQDIFISDNNGNTGFHLLAINGYDNILSDVSKLEPQFLKLKNNEDKFIFNLVYTRHDILYEIINIMNENNMISYLNFIRYDNRTLLLDIIYIIKDEKDIKLLTYLYKLDLDFNIPKKTPPLIYALTFENTKKKFIAKYMIENFDKLNFNIKNTQEFNPFIISLMRQFEYISLLLFDKNIDINYAGIENKYIPLIIAINNNFKKVLNKMIKNKTFDYNKKDNTLQTPIFYLLQSIYNNIKFDENIIKKIIKESDLLIQNIT